MFDVYAVLPGFNKSLLVAENVSTERVGIVMHQDIARQMAEDKRFGGTGGSYAVWSVKVHDSESGRFWRNSEGVTKLEAL